MRSATAKPCNISSAPAPITWQPTMRCSDPTVTSFISVRGLCGVSAWYIGTKLEV